MANVSHPNVDANSYTYIGPFTQQWNAQSSIINVLKSIHDDFLAKPPVPVQLVGTLPATQVVSNQLPVPRPQYVPETLNLARLNLIDLKNQVKQMAPQEQSTLIVQNSEMLLNMIMSSAETEPAKKELQKHTEEVRQLAESNLKLHSQIAQIQDQLEMSYTRFQSLKQQNEGLKAQEAQVQSSVSTCHSLT